MKCIYFKAKIGSWCWCECKVLDDRSFCKDDCMWNPITSDFQFHKACKIDKCLDIKNISCEKCLFANLVRACEEEIKQLIKKVRCQKNNCLVCSISL